jgi:hypothetical protein
MKRPIAISLLSVALGWLSIAGFGNALIMFSGKVDQLGRLSPLYGLLALAYGLLALFASTNLWRMKPQGYGALRAWMLVCLLFLVTFSVQFREYMLGGYLGAIGFLIFVGLIFIGLSKYVQSKLSAVT